MSCHQSPPESQPGFDRLAEGQVKPDYKGNDVRAKRLSVIDVLSMCEATAEEIEAFRSALNPDMRETFDGLDVARKWVLASLRRLSFDELAVLHEKELGRGVAGIHDFASVLTILFNGLPEFKRLWKQYLKERGIRKSNV